MSVSVLITTRNRRAFLAHVLERLRPGFRPGDELLLVDDGSDEPLDAFVDGLLPGAARRVIRHPESVGYIASRNEGLAACSHPIVLQLDDDSWPAGADALARAARLMAGHPRVGAFALPVHYHRRSAADECGSLSARWSARDLARETAFMGCGAVLRRDAVIRAGLYPAYYRYGGEEAALCARLYRLGYDTRLSTGIRVIHGHEELSLSTEYAQTRADARAAALAVNRLCFIAESFSSPVRPLLLAAAAARARRAGLAPSALRAEFEARRPLLLRSLRLGPVRSLLWAARMGAVAARLATGAGRDRWQPAPRAEG